MENPTITNLSHTPGLKVAQLGACGDPIVFCLYFLNYILEEGANSVFPNEADV